MKAKKSERRKLLVIDDDEGIRELLSDQLNALGVDVIVAEGFEDALKKFNETQFHAVLSDIMMPKKSGLQLLEEIRNRASDVPVVFLTGYANEQNLLQAIRLGAMDLMTKPVKQETLISVLSRAIEMGEKQSEIVALLTDLARKNGDPTKTVESIDQKKRQISLLKLVNNQKRNK